MTYWLNGKSVLFLDHQLKKNQVCVTNSLLLYYFYYVLKHKSISNWNKSKMKYIRLLKNKTIAILWLSQLLSATGDQIYLVCACWLAAQISPASIAIVAASEYLSAFCFSFLAGVLADRYNKRNLMLCSDLGRAVAVFSLPIASIFHPISIWHLAIVGICLGALGVLFDPCMIVTIPALADEQWLLQATNGLTDFTKRMARALGPALAGLLATVIPIQYLFNLDALSFLISAVGVVYIYSQINKDQEEIVIKSNAIQKLFI